MIQTTVTIDDAAWEAGVELQRAKYNTVNAKAQLSAEDFVAKLCLDALETYKQAAIMDVREAVAKLDYADIQDLAAEIKARAGAKDPPPVEDEVGAEAVKG